MEEFDPGFLVLVTGTLEVWAVGKTPASRLLEESFVREAERLTLYMRNECKTLGLAVSLKTVDELHFLLSGHQTPNNGQFRALASELLGRIRAELSGKFFLSLSLKEADLYQRPLETWKEIIERFRETTEDIEEGIKCLALARYPAAVFHALQVVEFGLIELGTFLNVTDPNSGWTAVSRALEKVVKKKREERTPFENANFPFLEQLDATVKVLKDAWRNKISHAQGRLAVLPGTFNAQIAEEIIFAARSFMRRLAEGLPKRQEGGG